MRLAVKRRVTSKRSANAPASREIEAERRQVRRDGPRARRASAAPSSPSRSAASPSRRRSRWSIVIPRPRGACRSRRGWGRACRASTTQAPVQARAPTSTSATTASGLMGCRCRPYPRHNRRHDPNQGVSQRHPARRLSAHALSAPTLYPEVCRRGRRCVRASPPGPRGRGDATPCARCRRACA